jgi:hypothetical protein
MTKRGNKSATRSSGIGFRSHEPLRCSPLIASWFGLNLFSLKATLDFSARPADEVNVPNSSAASARALEGPKCMNLRYLARQPIFDRDEKVFGYELLFRTTWTTLFTAAIPMLRLAPHWIVRRPKQKRFFAESPVCCARFTS